MTARFRRRGGGIVARFDAAEAAALRGAVRELIELLEAEADPAGDPALARLLPDAYRDDPDASAEFRRLTEDTLREDKTSHLRTLLGGLPDAGGAVSLDEAAAEAWLGALNDLRLTLGTRLEVTEDMDFEAAIEASTASPPAYALSLYSWLGWLQETLVRTLARR